MVSVFPAILDDGPEAIIERLRSSAEIRSAPGTPGGPAWVRLGPGMAENLAAVLDETGQGELAALIRKAASAIAAAA